MPFNPGNAVRSRYSRSSSLANETTRGTAALPASHCRRSASALRRSSAVSGQVFRNRMPVEVVTLKTDAFDFPMWTGSQRDRSTNARMTGGNSMRRRMRSAAEAPRSGRLRLHDRLQIAQHLAPRGLVGLEELAVFVVAGLPKIDGRRGGTGAASFAELEDEMRAGPRRCRAAD